MNRSSPLKRNRKKRAPGQYEFWAKVTEDGTKPCWFNNEDCSDWPLWHCDAHHLISKRQIKSYFQTRAHRDIDSREFWEDERDRALADPRNGIPCCRYHHNQLEAHRLSIARSELPESVEEFAKDYGLEAQLDRLYPPEVEAA